MQALRNESTQSLRASRIFAVAVALTLATAGLIGLMVVLMQVQPGFLAMTHFADPLHRVHDVTFGLLFGVAIVGLLFQLQRPASNVAGMGMSLVPWVGLLLAGLLAADLFRVMGINPAGRVAVATLITALLHPTGRDFFRSFSVSRISWPMLVLVVIVAVPLLAFAFANIGMQASVGNGHAAMGHYGFMAAFGFTAVGVGILASLRPVGWRLAAWVAGLLPALLGLASLLYPDNSSSLDLLWALAAIAWGAAFVAVAERIERVGLGAEESRLGVARESAVRPAGLVSALRVVALVPIVLVFINVISTMTGVGVPGLHAPPTGGHAPPIQHAPQPPPR
jgi:hypothetical protein